MKYYSPSKNGFYSDDVHNDMPDDVVGITQDQYLDLLDSQSRGLIIKPGNDGFPLAVEKPAPSAEQIRSARIAQIDLLLIDIDKKRARALSDAVLMGDKSRAQTLESQAQSLRDERKSLLN